MISNCYKFKEYNFNDGIFKNTVDATYIIHLENNNRLTHIMDQLSIYHPTDIVYICFNKGYKKCKKQDFIIDPPSDLIDAFITIFKHAKIMNYNNILILEDDFIFSKDILNKKHINNINDFLIKHNNDDFIYLLGCLPFFMIPYNLHSYRNISLGTHAVIYSTKNRKNILNNIDQKKINEWDGYLNKNFINKYCYYKPLCYQLCEETENSKYWNKNNNNIIIQKIVLINAIVLKYLYKILKMDKKPEPGFSYFYIFGKLFPFFFILLLFLLCNLL
jgi:hypothetical protein